MLQIPFDEDNDPYTAQFDSNKIAGVMAKDMHPSDPTEPPNNKNEPPNHLYPWLAFV